MPTSLPTSDPRKRAANSNQFDWHLGNLRKLARLLNAGLSYTDCGRIFGVSRGSIASTASRWGLTPSAEEILERKRQSGLERARAGRRIGSTDSLSPWERRLTERWVDYHARKVAERRAARG